MSDSQARAIGGSFLGGTLGGAAGVVVGGYLGGAPLWEASTQSAMDVVLWIGGLLGLAVGAVIGGVLGSVGGAMLGSAFLTHGAARDGSPAPLLSAVGAPLSREEQIVAMKEQVAALNRRIAELEAQREPPG